MAKLNVALIGSGSMGRNHARIYSEMDEVELVAICDANLEGAQKLAERYHARCYKDHVRLLKEERLDMVSIAVPTNLHYQIAKDCINAGVSVLIEKPISSTIAQGRELIALAKRKKVVLTVGHIERFNPAVQELKRRIDRGEIGTMFKISASRLSPFPTRIVDMGVIIDLAVHDIDVFSYLVGSPVVGVHAAMERKLHAKHEDICMAILRFKNGVIGMINIDRLTPVPVRELTVTGSKGMFQVNYLLQDLYLHKNSAADGENVEYTQHIMGVTPGDMVKIQIQKKEPLRLELEAFAEAVAKKSKPFVTGEQGLAALQLAHRILQAAKRSA